MSVKTMPKITILTDNYVRRRGLLAEHGLSFWIEDGADKVLFDAGQTDVYLHNAHCLRIDVFQAHAIILSHGHYDHTGGLAYLPEAARWPRVFVHPDAFVPKFEKTGDPLAPYQAIGIPWQINMPAHLERRLMFNTKTMQVGEHLFILTEILQATDYEEPSAALMVKKNEQMIIDDLHDEQVLVCQWQQGLVVVLGCGHRGVVNSLESVRLLFPDQPIYSIIGGMHLEKANKNRLMKTIDYFQKLDIKKIIPLHCTGQQVIWQMKRELDDRVLVCCAGDEIIF